MEAPRERMTMDRQRSQILGIIVLAIVLLGLACIRFYLKMG
jgi:hypothetical protein